MLAGPSDERDGARLYHWDGNHSLKPLGELSFKDKNPEAFVAHQQLSDGLQILTDNGGVLIGGKPCKKVKDARQRFFQGFTARLMEP